MELEHIAVRSGRLSSFLKGELNMSTGLMNRLKWTGALLVNGQPARTNTQVTPGDRITALLDDPEPEYPAEDMPLEIRYEDRDLLVVDKPPGMLIHPSRHRMTGTLANGVLGYYRRTGQACAFHPATRLDRDTFGLVLLAKNAHIHRLLNDIHTRGQLHKIYHGLVYGAPPEPEGTIDMPIGRCPKPSLLRRIDPLCQPARTRYRLLEQGSFFIDVVAVCTVRISCQPQVASRVFFYIVYKFAGQFRDSVKIISLFIILQQPEHGSQINITCDRPVNSKDAIVYQ